MSRRLAPLPLFALLAACAAPPAAAPVEVVVAPPAIASAPAPSASAAADEAPAPPEIEAPGTLGCMLPSSERYALSLRVGGAPFATLAGASSLVDLGTQGPSGGAHARAVSGGFTIHGIVAADALGLGPQRATVIAGFAIPRPSARFTWKGTAQGSITVALALDDDVEALPESHLDAITLACDAVVLGEASFDPDAVRPKSKGEREARIRKEKAIPIATTPGGPAVAKLRVAKDGDDAITVVEQRGRHALIVRDSSRTVIFGWVPASEVLRAAADRTGDMYGYGGLGLSGIGESRPERKVVCDRELALVALVMGEKRTVGKIAAGTVLRLGDQVQDVVSVELPENLASPEEGARVGVLASHLAGCAAK
jgi:hypothetical protein